MAVEPLDYDGPVPVWRQLADRIRADIESGKILPGRAVPSKRTLCEVHGVSGPTVDKVMSQLKAEGLIKPVRGLGLFVTRLEERGQG